MAKYDYFIKDHLGNTRMTLTEEQSTTVYMATMESEYTAFEESLFLNLSATRDSTVAAANYTQDLATQEDKSARLNGNIATRRVGPAKLIAVSPGDEVDMEVFAYFQGSYTNSGDVGQSNVVSAVAAAFGGSASAAVGTEARSVYELFNTNAALAFVGNSGNSSLPKAYLNYILFDQDFNDIASDYIQVGDTVNTHQQLNLSQSINQGGYLYVWISNDSQTDFNVYFDDLRITHAKGAILQEDHYYPFGMSINALSSSAPLSKPNKYNTFQGQEKTTDFDLGWYQFKWRNHDPTIGRFFNVDPLSEKFYYNSVYAFSENKVTSHIELEGLESMSIIAANKIKRGEVPLTRNEQIAVTAIAGAIVLGPLAPLAIESFSAAGALSTAYNSYNALTIAGGTYGPEAIGLGAGLLGYDGEIPGTNGDNVGRAINKGAKSLLSTVKELDGFAAVFDDAGKAVGRGWHDGDALNLAIKTADSDVKGRDVFNALFDYIDTNWEKIDQINGTWRKGDMDSNLQSFLNNIESMGDEAAAFNTFTGKMASEKGFTKAVVTKDIGSDGVVNGVDVVFKRQ